MSGFDSVFKAISHRTRREILSYLSKENKALNSSEINLRFAISWPTLCRHLDELKKARLISKRQKGREVYYTINKQRLTAVVKTWAESFDS